VVEDNIDAIEVVPHPRPQQDTFTLNDAHPPATGNLDAHTRPLWSIAHEVNGDITFEGETVVVVDTGESIEQPLFGDVVRYELLCRSHYRSGTLGD
jgi:hypothetical protein